MPTLTLALVLCSVLSSTVDKDEVIFFYPSYAGASADGKTWTAKVQGCVFELETSSIKRKLLIAAVRKTLDVDEHSREAKVLDERMRAFLVDHKGKIDVAIRIGSTTHKIATSSSNGHVAGDVDIPVETADRLAKADAKGGRWLEFSAVLPKGDTRTFTGRIQLVPPKGLSIISDIDDTIKVTQVRDRKLMMANTFLREFQSVPGMADLYSGAAKQGASVHFVSGGPWQLFEPLDAFRRKEGFPGATFAMKKVRLSSPTAIATLSTSEEIKLEAIAALLKAFPQRRFVLIGDSGEQDPETYGRITREHPKQIEAIWIRNVSDEKPDNERMRKAMASVDAKRFQLFRKATELSWPE